MDSARRVRFTMSRIYLPKGARDLRRWRTIRRGFFADESFNVIFADRFAVQMEVRSR